MMRMQPGETVAQFFSRIYQLKSDLEACNCSISESTIVLTVIANLSPDLKPSAQQLRYEQTGPTGLSLSRVKRVMQFREADLLLDQQQEHYSSPSSLFAFSSSSSRGAGSSGRPDAVDPSDTYDLFTASTDDDYLMPLQTYNSDLYRPFFLDSGASQHMITDREYFSSYTAFRPDSYRAVRLAADGHIIYAVGQGTVWLNTQRGPWQLSKALHVPASRHDFISVPASTDDGASFHFEHDRCMIRDSRLMVKARRIRNSYILAAVPLLADPYTPSLSDDEQHQHLHSYSAAATTAAATQTDAYMADVPNAAVPPSDAVLPAPTELSGTSAQVWHQRLWLVHMDVCGPIYPAARDGSLYLATFLDEFTRISVVMPMRSKAQVPDIVKQVIEQLETQSGQRCKAIRTDNGTEYVNKQMQQYCSDKGIIHQHSAPYSPEQNGAAERLNRTIMEKTRSILHAGRMGLQYWADAAKLSNYVRCVLPVTDQPLTPWESFFGVKPDLSGLRVFGSAVWVHVPAQKRSKLEAKAVRGVFVGYQLGSKSYKVLVAGREYHSKDVIFDEQLIQDLPTKPATQQLQQPELYAMTVTDSQANDNPSVAEALSGPQADMWLQAMHAELASLHENQTWCLVDKPAGARVLPTKWVLKIKRDAAGAIEKIKARLVAKGYMQVSGVDVGDVYAPVSKHTTLRTLLAKAAAEDMEVHQVDVDAAFLNGQLEPNEIIYVQQPEGFVEGSYNTVCKLQKALYGLRQAPRAWHARLKQVLEGMGFRASESDPALFTMQRQAGMVYLLVYVDDCLICTEKGDFDSLNYVKQQLSAVFGIKDLGDTKWFLGMKVTRDRAVGTLKLDQQQYVLELLNTYGMTTAHSKSVPMAPAVKLEKEGVALDTSEHSYSGLVGSLLYLSCCTRPDITYAVGALARYMSAPTQQHWTAARAILSYLKGTADQGLVFDYAGDKDTARSTTGYVFAMNGAAISWSSRLQPTVAMSTAESEYMAASSAVKEGLWLRKLMQDLQLPGDCTSILCDNQAALQLLHNPIASARAKHINVHHHFARERVARGEVSFSYCSTASMVADIMTKPLSLVKFSFGKQGCGVSS
ncbi:hypothetical protein QJQ45_013172 [Haematococcus lacustris]|nr:hypothetical protein QJQ45_013172 [Haematococcus lacustris]